MVAFAGLTTLITGYYCRTFQAKEENIEVTVSDNTIDDIFVSFNYLVEEFLDIEEEDHDENMLLLLGSMNSFGHRWDEIIDDLNSGFLQALSTKTNRNYRFTSPCFPEIKIETSVFHTGETIYQLIIHGNCTFTYA